MRFVRTQTIVAAIVGGTLLAASAPPVSAVAARQDHAVALTPGDGMAVAARACAGFSVRTGSDEGAMAFCEVGTVGDIRVVIKCLSEATFKPYTKFGVWRHQSATNFTYSEAYCRGADALVSHNYQTA